MLFAQLVVSATSGTTLHLNDPQGTRIWLPLVGPAPHPADHAPTPSSTALLATLSSLPSQLNREITLLPHGPLVGCLRNLNLPPPIEFPQSVYPPTLDLRASSGTRTPITPHLARLEAESIHIIREAVAEADNSVMLYSIGKDSSVMLHPARKAFYPAPPPFPLLHVVEINRHFKPDRPNQLWVSDFT